MDITVEQSLREAVSRHELSRLTETLHLNGVRHLYFKGSALAYSYYQTPAARQRVDSDILIEKQDREKAETVLLKLGFANAVESSEEAYSYQKAFIKETDWQTVIVDLHWNVSNRPLFDRLLTFSEAWTASTAAPRLSPNAKIFGSVHALVIAILHPIMHHHGEQDPIWWKDQMLICQKLTEQDWKHLVQFSMAKAIDRVLLEQLIFLKQNHSVDVPEFVLKGLDSISAKTEKSWIFAKLNNSLAAQKYLDFVHSSSIRKAMILLFATLFPPPRFILKKYGLSDAKLGWLILPWLYLKRILNALGRYVL